MAPSKRKASQANHDNGTIKSVRKETASVSPVPDASGRPRSSSLSREEGAGSQDGPFKPVVAAHSGFDLPVRTNSVASNGSGSTASSGGAHRLAASDEGAEAERAFFQRQIDEVEAERALLANDTHPEVRTKTLICVCVFYGFNNPIEYSRALSELV